ncbi:MobQ family relaxase [Sinorhizobium saheli]|uniref:MobQ family relaxase n=1 Tax=Sinorhizobium saheli TaxID=36856 RepID=UPI001294C384|nr:hypothetical protein [Sinorhizobium saheli]
MAIYHFSGQILGRTGRLTEQGMKRSGSKVVAAAAYRAGARLTDRSRGEVHDYSHRKGVAYAEIMTPPGSAEWLGDRELLWSAVESMETRKDAQLAREFNMALPHELEAGERLKLVRSFVADHFVRRGMVADLALHDPVPELGQDRRNVHAHVLLTLRRATASGLDPVKTREWNSRDLLASWRAAWSQACNLALERAGKRERIDHRTLAAQRAEAVQKHDMAKAADLDRQPEVHVGPRARQIARNGRTPASQVRTAHRRQILYPVHDRGTRIAFLETKIASNNARLKQDLQAIDRRLDWYVRKLDHWQRRAASFTEGPATRSLFRFPGQGPMRAAERQHQAEVARKAAHARKRARQLQQILQLIDGLALTRRRRFEVGLMRAREIEGWIRQVRGPSRDARRGRSRHR